MSKNITRTDSVAIGDLFVIWKTTDGDYRGVPSTNVLEFLQENLTIPESTALTTQYAAPSATGFTVAITDGSASIHLILTPSAGYAAGTITLPSVGNAVDKQEVLVNTTQQVTALTINGNGAVAVTGAPTSLGAEDFFRLKYDLASQTWYRIG